MVTCLVPSTGLCTYYWRDIASVSPVIKHRSVHTCDQWPVELQGRGPVVFDSFSIIRRLLITINVHVSKESAILIGNLRFKTTLFPHRSPQKSGFPVVCISTLFPCFKIACLSAHEVGDVSIAS
jgi:hypothetical protein